jgi:predicted amidophosphoribosyltransferase
MRGLLDVVLPARCAGCGDLAGPGCPRCLRALCRPARWTRPEPAPPGLPPVATVGSYDGAVRGLLLGYKEHGNVALARPLGAALGRAIALALSLTAAAGGGRHDAESIVVVPVPSSTRQNRHRGADVVADLAAWAARELRAIGRRVQVVRALRHIRAVADSAGLDARARSANAAGALGLRRGAAALVAARTVVIVDDLVTTGVSLAEATRVLQASSATVVAAATIAATGRRRLTSAAGGTGIRSPAAQPHGRALRC